MQKMDSYSENKAANGRLWRRDSSIGSGPMENGAGLRRTDGLDLDTISGRLKLHEASQLDEHVRSIWEPEAFCKISGFHGLRFWLQYNKQPSFWSIVRVCWVVLVLASLGATTYFSYDAVNEFVQYKTTTHNDVQRASNLPFPSVTICNFNALQYDSVSSAFNPDGSYTNLYLLCLYFGQTEGLCSTATDNRSMADVLLTYGHQKREMIPSLGPPGWFQHGCIYAGQPCSNDNFTLVMSEYGNCYTFNGNESSQLWSKAQGQKTGLEVLVNVEQESYFAQRTTAVGMAVYIHPPHRPLQAYHAAIAISPGTENFIAVRARKTIREPKPYNGPDYCITPAESKAVVQFYGEYSLAACKKECVARYVYAKCKCRMPEMPALVIDGAAIRDCTVHEAFTCGEKERSAFESNATAQEQYCSQCREACNETGFQYTTTLTTSRFMDYYSVKTLIQALYNIGVYLSPYYHLLPANATSAEKSRQNEENFRLVRENIVKLVVYFDDLNYEKRTEIPVYPVVSLFGDLGGNLGLFMGASFLTVLELIQFWLCCCKHRLSKSLRNYNKRQGSAENGTAQLVLWEAPLSADGAEPSADASRATVQASLANGRLPTNNPSAPQSNNWLGMV